MTPGWFGYSVIRNTVWAELYHEILKSGCRAEDDLIPGNWIIFDWSLPP